MVRLRRVSRVKWNHSLLTALKEKDEVVDSTVDISFSSLQLVTYYSVINY